MTPQERHYKNIQRKREERWGQPASNAKIEDLQSLISHMNKLYEYTGQLLALAKTLIRKGVITEAELEETIAADLRDFQESQAAEAAKIFEGANNQ